MTSPSPRTLRTDIQALRGVAILLVLLFHAKSEWCRAGYLGVDIFFVVSGFLITGILARGIQDGTFRFRAFYFRRAKRLLPAAYVCFAAAALLSVVFLSARERIDLSKQILGGLTFTTNFVLWRQIDYWSAAAHLKPLLHIWSLAVKEQFYLLVPAFLFVAPRRLWALLLGLSCLASAALCVALARTAPAAAFYLLPARGWELLMGSLGALLPAGASTALRRCFWPALFVLAAIPFLPLESPDPGLNALLVCGATLIVILRKHPLADQSFLARKLALVGDFSYSLYLVHWPIFAFAYSCWVTEPPVAVRVSLLCCAFLLGYLLFRAVERPIWQSDLELSVRTAGIFVMVSLILGAIAFVIPQVNRSEVDFAAVRRANYGFAPNCDSVGDFAPHAECRSSSDPQILVWGDSFAMALVPGVVASATVGVIQATKSVCGPFLEVAPLDDDQYRLDWARGCIRFNESVFAYLRTASSVKTVVLTSAFSRYVQHPVSLRHSMLLMGRPGDSQEERDPSVSTAVKAMKHTVNRIRGLGKLVVVVAPPPAATSFEIGECLERKASGLPLFGRPSTNLLCSVPMTAYRASRASVLEFLWRLPGETRTAVFSFDDFLCNEVACRTELDGTLLYRDSAHLSRSGSEVLGRAIGLTPQLLQLAE